ncbi:MAG: YncE family protein, partial [Alphaproteobacteria bacterium]
MPSPGLRRRAFGLVSSLAAAVAMLVSRAHAAGEPFVNFESGPVRPVALSSDGARLCVTNTPDGRLETFGVGDGGLVRDSSVKVGMEPVAVALHGNMAWVVNHLSDSVTIVDLEARPPRVVRTLLVGDEPRDVVFAGPGRSRAFVTTAHRGQNSPVDPQLSTPGVGRADVWVFDVTASGEPAGDRPSSILTLFGDTPRALAASADGSEVWAAVFLSGNRTATVSQEAVCDGGASAPPCSIEGISMPGGLPAPNLNVEGLSQPESGLIVGFDPVSGAWRDGIGRDWRGAMRFSLPDLDVFRIDASSDPPREVEAWSDVGTVIYGLAVNPATGSVYAANTEANNRTRFSGAGLLSGQAGRGHVHESLVSVLGEHGVLPVHLNPHVD